MKFVESELKQLSIHHLRKIAREVGVKSPTTLKKEGIIAEILSISSGIKTPYFSKKGRPCIKNEHNNYNQKNLSEEKLASILELINSCVNNILNVLNEKECQK